MTVDSRPHSLAGCRRRDGQGCYPDCGCHCHPEPELRRIEITICQACLDGEGNECHTPGCAFWMHSVDLPIDPSAYIVLDTSQRGTP